MLINDADWELEGKEEAEIVDRDRVSFISTLHGGWLILDAYNKPFEFFNYFDDYWENVCLKGYEWTNEKLTAILECKYLNI